MKPSLLIVMKNKRFKRLLLAEAIRKTIKEQQVAAAQQQPQAQPQAPDINVGDQQGPAVPNQQLSVGIDSVDSIIEKLNLIRGGSSFKDPEVYGQLTTWYNNIPDEMKVTLNDYMTAISNIVMIDSPEADPNKVAPPPTQATPPSGSPSHPSPQQGGTQSAPVAASDAPSLS